MSKEAQGANDPEGERGSEGLDVVGGELSSSTVELSKAPISRNPLEDVDGGSWEEVQLLGV